MIDKHRLLIQLRDIEGFSYNEIAEIKEIGMAEFIFFISSSNGQTKISNTRISGFEKEIIQLQQNLKIPVFP